MRADPRTFRWRHVKGAKAQRGNHVRVYIRQEAFVADAEEHMKKLKLIEEGKISAEDGVKLLSALGERRRVGVKNMGFSADAARWLRIRVTDNATGRSKAAVQIPLGLIDAGQKMGARFVPEVEGVDIASVMDAMRSGVIGRIMDVTDDENGEHIEIFIE